MHSSVPNVFAGIPFRILGGGPVIMDLFQSDYRMNLSAALR